MGCTGLLGSKTIHHWISFTHTHTSMEPRVCVCVLECTGEPLLQLLCRCSLVGAARVLSWTRMYPAGLSGKCDAISYWYTCDSKLHMVWDQVYTHVHVSCTSDCCCCSLCGWASKHDFKNPSLRGNRAAVGPHCQWQGATHSRQVKLDARVPWVHTHNVTEMRRHRR